MHKVVFEIGPGVNFRLTGGCKSKFSEDLYYIFPIIATHDQGGVLMEKPATNEPGPSIHVNLIRGPNRLKSHDEPGPAPKGPGLL